MSGDDSVPIERMGDTTMSTQPGWVDVRGRTPIGLYVEYLTRRRKWEERAWKLGGSDQPAFSQHLRDLEALHEDLSVPSPIERRDTSVARPASRDPRKVRVASVERAGDHVVLHTLEDEFQDLLPIAYRVEILKTNEQWRLVDRVTDLGRGRRIHSL